MVGTMSEDKKLLCSKNTLRKLIHSFICKPIIQICSTVLSHFSHLSMFSSVLLITAKLVISLTGSQYELTFQWSMPAHLDTMGKFKSIPDTKHNADCVGHKYGRHNNQQLCVPYEENLLETITAFNSRWKYSRIYLVERTKELLVKCWKDKE